MIVLQIIGHVIPLWIYAFVLVLSLAVFGGLIFMVYKFSAPPKAPEGTGNNREARTRRSGGGRRRIDRMAGSRRGRASRAHVSSSDEETEEDREIARATNEDHLNLTRRHGKKIGTKKAEKLAQKEERRKEREAWEAMKAIKKEKEKHDEEEQEKQRLEEEEERKRRIEEAKRLAKEKEEREIAELNEWKDLFEIEETGSRAAELEEKEKELLRMPEFIKEKKVVTLEELAIEFNIKIEEVLVKIEKFEEEGNLTGVIDERGKYIYITPEEMESVAKFINFQGRVHIREIAAQSNRLINLNPESK
eukprot:CAMPEP_0174260268 /NCGR_PEP_ID=MMETSP0439-20130205/9452_1 /TAXON_ID=0 /ORGANISM="Stereomyxa ramosa, Strain Chinc5" /LENGTH=304 /DNA_ID=CAMNT_0015344481 /DNA_START=38 /DNA_END=952 /DNA_ORIENTATION=-